MIKCNRCGAGMVKDHNDDWMCVLCGNHYWTGSAGPTAVSSIVNVHGIDKGFIYSSLTRLLTKIQQPESV